MKATAHGLAEPLTSAQLLKIMPLAGLRADRCVGYLNQCFERFGIDTVQRRAEFLGQIAHESGQLAYASENLNYGAQGLMKTWPRRFPNLVFAQQFARRPEKIASYVYANRMGNGNEASGDGWRYRGAGWFQVTGRDNHSKVAEFFEMDLEDVGDWLRTPEGAAMSAGWYWQTNNLSQHADRGDTDAISDLINIGRRTEREGDAIGYKDRLHHRNLALRALA